MGIVGAGVSPVFVGVIGVVVVLLVTSAAVLVVVLLVTLVVAFAELLAAEAFAASVVFFDMATLSLNRYQIVLASHCRGELTDWLWTARWMQ